MRFPIIKGKAEPKLLTVEDAKARYSLGRDSIKQIAQQQGAIVRIGRAVRVNINVLDNYFDSITGDENGNAMQ